MSNPKMRVEPAETEAAAWHARLGASRVDPATIEAFFAWRQNPVNADAYRRVEKIWADSGALARDPLIAGALDAAMSRRAARRPAAGIGRGLAGLAAIGGAAALGLGLWLWVDGRGVYATSVGEQRVVQLTDGSSVRLDTGSRVRVRFDDARRQVELEQGQALFTVAHDAGRPFVVAAGAARVTAVGTVFDVRREAGEVRVTLVSGAVDVEAGQGRDKERMVAGRQARIGTERIRIAPVDVVNATSWTEGRVAFRGTPLKTAVDEVNRYLTQKVVLDAPGLEAEPVSGVFKTGDRDAFVSAATAALGLRATAAEDGAVRLSAEK